MSRPCRMLPVLLAVVAVFPSSWAASDEAPSERYAIGVLAKRGPERCREKWESTAAYLSEHVDPATFLITPLGFEDIEEAVATRQVDFVLVNPAIYVTLEHDWGAVRLATLKNRNDGGDVTTRFGGVLFCRTDRVDLQYLSDVHGQSVAAVAENSFGGWLAVRRELHNTGRIPEAVAFLGTHDNVVLAVRDGTADFGSVRTNTLERMAQEGAIALDEFRVIASSPKGVAADFPFRCSTTLYPEWPFAALAHVPTQLSEHVSAALLELDPDDAAAKAARCAGWTVPLNYAPVHDCLRELGLGPYAVSKPPTLAESLKEHWPWMVGGLMALGGLGLLALYLVRLNHRLRERELILGSITDSARDAILMIDSKGAISFWNPAATRLLGYAQEEAMGRNLHERIAPQRYLSAYRQAFPGFCKTGKGSAVGQTLELHARRKDGEEIPIELSLSAICLHGAWYAVGIMRDITERKRSEERLRDLLEQQEAVFDTSLVGIMLLHNRILTKVNRRMAEMLGYTQEEMEGRGPEQLHLSHDHFVEFGEKYYWRLAEMEIVQVEYPLRHRDGHTVWCLFNGRAIAPPDLGRGAVWIIDDITERKQADQALRESKEQLDLAPPFGPYGHLGLAHRYGAGDVGGRTRRLVRHIGRGVRGDGR